MPDVPALSLAVRRAEPTDTDELIDLGSLARQAIEASRGGTALLRELDDHPPGRWAVATIDGMVVGMAGVDHSVDGVALLRCIFVREEARQLGLGEQLLDWVLADAAEDGCQRFDGIALPGDRSTKNLFERAGIVARAIIVSRPL